jgi:hypothetical protein
MGVQASLGSTKTPLSTTTTTTRQIKTKAKTITAMKMM